MTKFLWFAAKEEVVWFCLLWTFRFLFWCTRHFVRLFLSGSLCCISFYSRHLCHPSRFPFFYSNAQQASVCSWRIIRQSTLWCHRARERSKPICCFSFFRCVFEMCLCSDVRVSGFSVRGIVRVYELAVSFARSIDCFFFMYSVLERFSLKRGLETFFVFGRAFNWTNEFALLPYSFRS